VPFDLVSARLHASIWAQLAAKGVNVGAHDLLIGATALAIGRDVATRDKRSFPKIPGLRVVTW
jgi:predicted nucleic acid-binding protein